LRNDIATTVSVLPNELALIVGNTHTPLVTEDQREALLDLLLNHGHYKIAPEIRRELLAGRGRGVPAEQAGPTFDGDDTMLLD
jgi:essential nuclear protein 1